MARTCTLKGKPLNLEGPELKVGDKAPYASLRKNPVELLRPDLLLPNPFPARYTRTAPARCAWGS